MAIVKPKYNPWDELMLGAARQEDKVPDGWYRIDEIATKYGLSRSTTRTRVANAVKAGKAEVRKFAVLATSGRIMRTPHYSLKTP